ncbi:MAG TPA: 30S ribosomal protein S8 [Thermoplasmata archaeon]|nr:30S ribosomal protein S8 [Thermoplasmata archaeon]
MLQDSLNDAMSVIKNAEKVGRGECLIRPSSKLIGRVLKVMQENGYIRQFEVVDDGRSGMFKVMLSGHINNCGVIRPRYSVKVADLEKFEARYLPAQDFGVLILTTTKGVVTHMDAKRSRMGGKLLAFVY